MNADRVQCSSCGEIMFVIPGTEVCPKCKLRGVLSWVDENQQEVEVAYNDVINLDDYENIVNETEESIN